jgi:uncharacterized membrane-anchored protein
MSTMTISNHVISVGNKIIQMSNVSEATIWKDTSHRSRVFWLIFAGFVALLFGLSAFTRDEAIRLFLNSLYGLGDAIGLTADIKQAAVTFTAFIIGVSRRAGASLLSSYPSANIVVFLVAGGFLIAALLVKPKYLLYLHTTAGIITALTSKNRKFIHKVLDKIQYAMQHPNANINFKVNTVTNNITDSTIGTMVGRDSK